MHHFPPLTFLAALSVSTVLAQGSRDIGRVEVAVEGATIPVRITAAPAELNTLAHLAFQSHGRYRRVTSGHAYELTFTPLSGNQVRVDITRGAAATPVASETVTGSTLRNALLRAADFAVERTNGLGLRGFFAARLAFVGEATGRKEVYVSDLFLGEAKRITSDSAPVLTPRWSPDGARLLYTSYFKSGFPDIFQHD
ncbi:MAG: biopolymer transporter Tol, partial [Opitutus sp.]